MIMMETDDLYKASHRLIDDEKPVLSKAIVIGAGDVGIKCLFSAKSLMEKRIHPQARRYIRWVAVNSKDIESTGREHNDRYRFPADQFAREERNILYLSFPGTSDMSRDFFRIKYKTDLCFDWLPDPDIYDISRPDDPVRALGRFNFFLNEDYIRRSLIKERDRLDQLPDEARYFRLACTKEGIGRKKPRISVFIIASPSCVTGSGIFFDIAAMMKDIFRNSRQGTDISGILVHPVPAVNNDDRIMSDTYAFFKELDYYMSGGRFMSTYPSGRKVEVQDSLFNDGKVYLLEPENMAGGFLNERGHVYDLAGELVSAFISGFSGGAIDSSRAYERFGIPLYNSTDGKPVRKACYSSFGISRAVYPVPELIETGYRAVAVKMIESFFKPVNAGLLAETLGSINRGLVRSLKLDCRMIFERIYPGHKADIENESVIIRKRFIQPEGDRDKESVMAVMKSVIASYDREGLDKRRHLMVSVMERRYRPELERIRNVLIPEIRKYIQDQSRGLLFSSVITDILRERLDLYIKKYRVEGKAIGFYSASDMEEFMVEQGKMETCDEGLIEALCGMASFNYRQSLYGSMLASAETFAVEFRGIISWLKNSVIGPLCEKTSVLKKNLQFEMNTIRSGLLEERNPFIHYLVTDSEIDSFIEKHFYSETSIQDLCQNVDFESFSGIEDEPVRVMETSLISKLGLPVLDMDENQIYDIIAEDYGECNDKSPNEIISMLYGDNGDGQDSQAEYPLVFTFGIDNIKKNLFRIIHLHFSDSDFSSVSVKDILEERQIAPDSLLEQLDVFSRPYINADMTLPGPVEYYRAVAGFKLDADDQGGETLRGNVNDLPPRLKDSAKRKNSEPPVMAEIFEAPVLCGNFEVVSTGAFLGLPLQGIISICGMSDSYHAAVSDRKRPPHVFNSSSCNAKYFPDPSGDLNYLDPVRLWSGLILLDIIKEKDGVYSYIPELVPALKDIEARENYRKVILELYRKIEEQRGADNIRPELLAEVVSGLGILAKNPSDGRLQFRRDYLPVIADIMDDLTAGSTDMNPRRDMSIPKFSSSMELVAFLEGNSKIKRFITDMIKSVIERSIRNITAGADISLPSRKIEQTVLPVFRNKFEFYDYYERKGSLEWQNVLMKILSEKLDMYMSSPKFRLNDGSNLPDRLKVSELLKALEQRIPQAVLMEADLKNRSGL